LLHMARVLVPVGKLLMLMLTIIYLLNIIDYYTLKQPTEIIIMTRDISKYIVLMPKPVLISLD
jgi:hypothetical protein